MRSFALHTRLFYLVLCAVLVGLFGVSTLLANRSASASTGGPTRVVLVPPKSARVGEPITVSIVALDARNLAGFQAGVRYDASNLRVTTGEISGGLRTSGRDVLSLGPVMREGAVVLGAATCPVKDCYEPLMQEAARITQGASGRVELGSINFYTRQPGTYSLKLESVQLVDPQGHVIPSTSSDLVLVVQE